MCAHDEPSEVFKWMIRCAISERGMCEGIMKYVRRQEGRVDCQ